MQNPNVNKQKIRQNKQRIRNKVKSMNLSSKLKYERELSLDADAESQRRCKSLFYSTSFESLFELGDKLGQGAHGVVRKCVEKSTGTTYCVKITRGDEEYIRISKKTYQLLYLVDSPHIIKPKSLFIDERTETIYLVMEYCPYSSLQREIVSNSIQPSDVRKLIKTILEAVCEMHRVGVCHRDLKPDNILYDRETGKIKIIDLGVSKLLYNKKKEAKEKMWTVTGTIHYKAPEMFLGKEYDELVDSWAIGIITYQLVYGKVPFESAFLGDLIEQIIEKQPQYSQDTDLDSTLAIDFMRSLLRKDHKRSTCFQASHHPWMSASRSRLASQTLQNLELMFTRCRQMSVKMPYIDNTRSPKLSTTEVESGENTRSESEVFQLTGYSGEEVDTVL